MQRGKGERKRKKRKEKYRGADDVKGSEAPSCRKLLLLPAQHPPPFQTEAPLSRPQVEDWGSRKGGASHRLLMLETKEWEGGRRGRRRGRREEWSGEERGIQRDRG